MPTDEEIRDLVAVRAFELSRRRRPEEGDELSDWLRAEAEVLDELRSAEANPGQEASAPQRGGRPESEPAVGKAQG